MTPAPVGAEFYEKMERKDSPIPFFTSTLDIKDQLISNLMDQLKVKDERIKELTDLLLETQGIVRGDKIVQIPESKQQLTPNQRWDAVRQRLEKRYAKTESEIRAESKDYSSAADNVLAELTEDEDEDEIA